MSPPVSLARTLWFIPTIAWLFSFYPAQDDKNNAPPSQIYQVEEVYDFIIIGGGTAGSVLANRLSEDENRNVLLLEAGGLEPHEVQIPAVAPYLQLTELDWTYLTEPSSTSCLAMNENRCRFPRGKVLGGSSSLNYMIYVRGNKNDYDMWEAFGNIGWGFEDVMPYFKKSEDNGDADIATDKVYHSTGGYQKINRAPWNTPLAKAFLQAGEELNIPTIDINGKIQTGFMLPQGFCYNGARYSASKAFLQPIRHRTNLNILLHATVTKILFNEKNNHAYSVQFEWNSQNHTVNASKEIILSAGAFGTPQILMLSGIGPGDHLRSLGIAPIVDLQVGRNLQDHVASGLTFIINEPMSISRDRLASFASIYKYIWGSGPLTTLGAVEGIGFANTKYNNGSTDWPDIEFHFLSGSCASDGGEYLRHTFNFREDVWQNYLSFLSNLETFTVISKLMRPRSRGYVELQSLNPKEKVKITSNYFQDSFDILTMVEGIKLSKMIGDSKAFKKFNSKQYSRHVPGCEHLEINSDEYFDCYARHITFTIYHYCGTAKMGPYWDKDAVVDPYLRVYGTSGLRVVDASIFPTISTGNTNAVVMMVAEKAADIIREYWNVAKISDTHPGGFHKILKRSINVQDQVGYANILSSKVNFKNSLVANDIDANNDVSGNFDDKPYISNNLERKLKEILKELKNNRTQVWTNYDSGVNLSDIQVLNSLKNYESLKQKFISKSQKKSLIAQATYSNEYNNKSTPDTQLSSVSTTKDKMFTTNIENNLIINSDKTVPLKTYSTIVDDVLNTKMNKIRNDDVNIKFTKTNRYVANPRFKVTTKLSLKNNEDLNENIIIRDDL